MAPSLSLSSVSLRDVADVAGTAASTTIVFVGSLAVLECARVLVQKVSVARKQRAALAKLTAEHERTAGKGHDLSTTIATPVPKGIKEVAWQGREWFYREHIVPGVPCLLPGYAAQWKAVKEWSPQYFADLSSHGRDIEVAVSLSNEEVNGTVKTKMTFRQYIELLQSYRSTREPRSSDASQPSVEWRAYLKQFNIGGLMPELSSHLVLEGPEGPFNENTVGKVNFWMGPAGATTGLHNDDENNVVVQIMGEKQLVLIPPSQGHLLYPNDKYDSGTICCDADPSNPDLKRHPLYSMATPFVVVLQPGDMLFLPKNWYHHVTSLSESISINYFVSTPWELVTEGSWRVVRHLLHKVGLLPTRRCVCHVARGAHNANHIHISMDDADGDAHATSISGVHYGSSNSLHAQDLDDSGSMPRVTSWARLKGGCSSHNLTDLASADTAEPVV
eukprot:GFYU01010473.1.p1 GENE.GFYU01010473.1~~GFYU01010473.1.p1  ORF type:complete len:446 (-),score=56.51 GFYU01010473.1:159-1496(-)